MRRPAPAWADAALRCQSLSTAYSALRPNAGPTQPRVTRVAAVQVDRPAAKARLGPRWGPRTTAEAQRAGWRKAGVDRLTYLVIRHWSEVIVVGRSPARRCKPALARPGRPDRGGNHRREHDQGGEHTNGDLHPERHETVPCRARMHLSRMPVGALVHRSGPCCPSRTLTRRLPPWREGPPLSADPPDDASRETQRRRARASQQAGEGAGPARRTPACWQPSPKFTGFDPPSIVRLFSLRSTLLWSARSSGEPGMVTRIEVETTLAHCLDEAAGDTCQALRNAIVDALLCLDEAEHRRARAEASVSRGFARLGPPRGSTAQHSALQLASAGRA
jgi:hypothetical protein